MKKVVIAFAMMGFLTTAFTTAFAEETMGEKAEATMNDAKRATKKGAHRVKEAVCAKGDVECAKQKASHRAQEAGDYVKDKAKEVKNNVD